MSLRKSQRKLLCLKCLARLRKEEKLWMRNYRAKQKNAQTNGLVAEKIAKTA